MLGVLGALGLLTPVAAHDPVTTKVTFDREVRTILQARCGSCHSPGAPAPMPLTTYDEVRPWARAIKDQVLARRMPIWQAAHGYGAFANDPSLTPTEIALIAAWVDGGQPKGSAGPPPPARGLSARVAGRAVFIPAAASTASIDLGTAWISSWDFEPGDPLVTAATFTSVDGAPIGTWVAGDVPVRLPVTAAVRVASPVQVRIERRKAADYEKPFTAQRSVLRIVSPAEPPHRAVWVEETACGMPRTGRNATLLAVRPLLEAGASAKIWLERPGAPRAIVGWFRDADVRYPRTYWLARETELPPESRVQADAPCRVEMTLASR